MAVEEAEALHLTVAPPSRLKIVQRAGIPSHQFCLFIIWDSIENQIKVTPAIIYSLIGQTSQINVQKRFNVCDEIKSSIQLKFMFEN